MPVITRLARGASTLKLNGWQRAWVLVSVLYFAFVIIISYSIYQDNIEYLMNKERNIVAKINKYNSEKAKSNNNNEIKDIFDDLELIAVSDINERNGIKYYPSREDIEDSIGRLTNNNKIDFSEAEKEYKNNVFWQHIRHIFYTFLICLIPSLFLYGFGYSVGWVMRGFRNKNI